MTEAAPIGFRDLPSLVREGNRHAKSATLDVEAAKASTPSAVQAFYPSLHLEAGAEIFQRELLPQRTDLFGSLEAELNLFRGGKDFLGRKIKKSEAEQAQLGAAQTFLTELTKARKAYVGLVYCEALKAVLREAQNLNDKNLSSASRRRASGRATDTDQLEFEIKRQSIEQDLESVELQLSSYQAEFAVLVDMGASRFKGKAFWPNSFEDPSYDLNRLRGNRRETLGYQIEALDAGRKRAESQIASRWWVPDIDLFAGYELASMRDSDEFRRSDRDQVYAGIRARLTLFDGGNSLRSLREKDFLSQSAQLRLQQSKLEDQAHVQVAVLSIEKSERLVKGAKASVKSAKRYLSQTLSEYSRGVKNSPDVSSATDKYIEAETRLLEIQREYYVAVSDLLASLGAELPENN